MTEHPIIFSGDMVRALLAGQKSVTRRLSKKWLKVKRGHLLWVREAWAIGYSTGCLIDPCLNYRADGQRVPLLHHKDSMQGLWYHCESNLPCSNEFILDVKDGWHPSIHMPRWASRITLEATEDAREEPLQDITVGDAIGEGAGFGVTENEAWARDRVASEFCALWDSLHKDAPWASNPTVVRLAFKVPR